MDQKRLIEIKILIEKTLALPKAERDAFIEHSCGNDVKMKNEVVSLVEAYEKSGDFLDKPLTLKADISEVLQDPMIGKPVGNYVIEKQAGIGGAGIVYAARRNDKAFEKKVAIKILKYGLSSDYLLKRFRIERQALANLQHENITRMLDGGRTGDGLPYLVMEYVEGISITDYCKKHHYGIREKLALFYKVCSAIQYAHKMLVIHRDIKPGNILVTEDGIPKLMDFGIVKIIDDDFAENASGLTMTGIWNLTPDYASPEQVNGDKITTASDIYSMGVLLYELLAGEKPYRITTYSPIAIGKIINNSNIPKPSEKVRLPAGKKDESENPEILQPGSGKIARQLRGDLDNIVMKAMHKDPDQRYASVIEFKEDINRYLNGMPVKARRDSLSYIVAKFIKRNKVGFALFILSQILVISGIVAIINQRNIANRERDKATVELKKFEAVNNFLLDMMSSADPGVNSRDVKVYDLLEKAASDVDTKFKDQPEVRTAVIQTLGTTFNGLGEYEKAEPLLRQAYESNKKLYGEYSKETAKSAHMLGSLYDNLSDYQRADTFYLEGIKIYESISKKPLKNLADNLNDYGYMISNMGYYDSSITIFKRALDIYKLYDKEKGVKEASTINNLAVALHQLNRLDEAEPYYREAMEIMTRVLGKYSPEIASVQNNLAYVYLDNKKMDKAEDAFIKANKIKQVVYGPDHPSTGLGYMNLGMFYFITKEYDKAETSLFKAISLFKRIDKLNDPILAHAYYWLGEVYIETNELSEAEDMLQKSLSIRKEIYTGDNIRIWSTEGELGICALKQKRYKQAEKQLVESLDYFKKNPDHKKLLRLTDYLAQLYSELGNKEKADYYKIELDSLNAQNQQKQ